MIWGTHYMALLPSYWSAPNGTRLIKLLGQEMCHKLPGGSTLSSVTFFRPTPAHYRIWSHFKQRTKTRDKQRRRPWHTSQVYLKESSLQEISEPLWRENFDYQTHVCETGVQEAFFYTLKVHKWHPSMDVNPCGHLKWPVFRATLPYSLLSISVSISVSCSASVDWRMALKTWYLRQREEYWLAIGISLLPTLDIAFLRALKREMGTDHPSTLLFY